MDNREFNELEKFISKLNNAVDYGAEGRLTLIDESVLKIEDLRARLSDAEDELKEKRSQVEDLMDKIRQLNGLLK